MTEEKLRKRINDEFLSYCKSKSIYPIPAMKDLFLEGITLGINIAEEYLMKKLSETEKTNFPVTSTNLSPVGKVD